MMPGWNMIMLLYLLMLTNNTIHRSTGVSLRNNMIKLLPMLASLERNDDIFYMH